MNGCFYLFYMETSQPVKFVLLVTCSETLLLYMKLRLGGANKLQ